MGVMSCMAPSIALRQAGVRCEHRPRSTLVDETVTAPRPSTFLFADIAGFTALTEAHGDDDAADLALDFGERVREILPPGDGELVKTIGDALMVRLASPALAVTVGLVITHELMADHGQPAVRVGMHMGPASERGGDFFGATVNLAARIAGAAAGGEVLLSEVVHREASGLAGVQFSSRGAQRLRNVPKPIVVYSAERTDAERRSGRALDPVCHMAMIPGREASRMEHEGTVYLFCSELCAERFAAAPEDYAAPSGR